MKINKHSLILRARTYDIFFLRFLNLLENVFVKGNSMLPFVIFFSTGNNNFYEKHFLSPFTIIIKILKFPIYVYYFFRYYFAISVIFLNLFFFL